MLFFPYKAQIKLTKVPVVTILISLLCIAVFIEQSRNERALFEQTAEYCTAEVAGQIELITDRYLSDLQSWPCEYILLDVYARPRPSKYLNELIREIDSPYDEVFREHYDRFSDVAMTYVTATLWQERPSWNIGRMLTGSIAHGSWEHLIFNLVFFFAFAATVELLIGPVLFLGACLGLAIGIGCIDTLVHLGSSEVTATVGLSGVVMGMLGLFAFFVPRVKIRFFYWFLIFVGTVGIPAWAVAAWYIGWDMYYQITQTGGMTNLVAHLAGAALGFGIGFVVFREKKGPGIGDRGNGFNQGRHAWAKTECCYKPAGIGGAGCFGSGHFRDLDRDVRDKLLGSTPARCPYRGGGMEALRYARRCRIRCRTLQEGHGSDRLG